MADAILTRRVMTQMVNDFILRPANFGLKIFQPLPIDGIKASWDVMAPNRTTGKARAVDGPSHEVPLIKIGDDSAEVFLVDLKKTVNEQILSWLRAPGQADNDDGRRRMRQELQDLTAEVSRTYDRWCLLALTGTLTTTVAQDGIAKSINYQYPAANLPTSGADWQTASTDIIGDLDDWKRVVAQGSGRIIRRGYMNGTTAKAFIKNTAIKALLTDDISAGRGTKQEALETGFIGHIQGIDFFRTDDQYIDTTGAAISVIADDRLILTAGDDEIRGVCALQVGTQLIREGNADAARRVRGRFAYSEPKTDPVRNLMHSGWNALPVITVPSAFIYADTSGP